MARPPVEPLVKIAKYYGVSMDELVSVDLRRYFGENVRSTR